MSEQHDHSHISPRRSPSLTTITVEPPKVGHRHKGLRPLRAGQVFKRTTRYGQGSPWYEHVHEFIDSTSLGGGVSYRPTPWLYSADDLNEMAS